ncbi:MAG: sigma-70 family RNA polymerase sigma factor [Planctomyces sp.]
MPGSTRQASRTESSELKSRQSLRDRAASLLKQEIRFVYSPEFELRGTSEEVVGEALELVQSLRAAGAAEREAAELQSSDDNSDSSVIRAWNSGDPLLTAENERVLFQALNLLRYQVNQLRSRLSAVRPRTALVESIEEKIRSAELIREQLVRSNLRLVTSIARKFAASGTEVDEFSSDGCSILLGAIDRFDISRGFRFSTYATHSIQRHFFRAWRVRQRRKERFPNASGEILSEVPQEATAEPICSDPESVVSGLMARADQVLDAREHRILVDRFGLTASGRASTLREIAGDLGISKERVRQLQLKALEKLRNLMDPDVLRQFGGDLMRMRCSAS